MHKLMPILVLALSCLLACASAENVIAKGREQLSTSYSLEWAIFTPDNDATQVLITLTATAKCVCWVGIGFHGPNDTTTKGMTKADFLVATFDQSGNITASDRFASTQNSGFSMPLEDTQISGGQNNIISYSGSQDKNLPSTSFTVTRAVKTTDAVADWPILPGLWPPSKQL